MSLDVYLTYEIDTGGKPYSSELFSSNYTHNCGEMAKAAGIYQYVWRPDECPDVKLAGDLIAPLAKGIQEMTDNPSKFIAMNPKNKWGSYETFLPWLKEYLQACKDYPKASVHVSR